jgi:hypothetical protein
MVSRYATASCYVTAAQSRGTHEFSGNPAIGKSPAGAFGTRFASPAHQDHANDFRFARRKIQQLCTSRWDMSKSIVPNERSGKVGWVVLWLLGVPIPVLLILFLIRGCT